MRKIWMIAVATAVSMQMISCESKMEEEEEEEEEEVVITDTTNTGGGNNGGGSGTTKTYCDTVTPTYNSDIKLIIDANCATSSGCHGNGSGQGNFTTFSGLNVVVANGKFKNEVITKKTMPFGFSLSASDFEKVQCWLDKGAKEN